MDWLIAASGDALNSVMADVSTPTFWVGVAQIMWIDILLAGDNAVVIALACRKLPPRQRMWGMIFGAGVAVLLRIGFTLIVATLMTMPYLKLAGGVALFYIAIKLVLNDDDGPDEDSITASHKLWNAVRIIAVADIVMSLDNVIAIAGASKGHTTLFVFGLAASIPLVIAGAGLVMKLLARYPVLVWVGGAVLGWVGGQVIATDPAVQDFVARRWGHEVLPAFELAALTLGAIFVFAIGSILGSRNAKRPD